MRSRRTVKRLILAITIAVAMPLAMAANVSAKMPYFTVEIEPPVPVAGQPFLVIVRTWQDADHAIPAGFDAVEALSGLLVARRPNGDSSDVAIPLVLRGPDRFEASVTLPTGDWTLVAFPNRAGWASPVVPVGYPDTIPLSVRAPAPALTGIAAASVVLAGVLVVIALVQRRRRTTGFSRLRRSQSVERDPAPPLVAIAWRAGSGRGAGKWRSGPDVKSTAGEVDSRGSSRSRRCLHRG